MKKRALTKEDLFQIQSISNPQYSPAGDEAVFIKTLIDEEENKYFNYLYYINLKSNKITQWTFGKENISASKWSPNGKIISFISNRDGKTQLYFIGKNGGEAQKMTSLEQGITSYLWSPCGEKIWFTSTLKSGQQFNEANKKTDSIEMPTAYIVENMKYKQDGLGSYGLVKKNTFTHIYSLNLKDQSIEQFTEGDLNYSLNDISPNGHQLILGVNREIHQDYQFKNTLLLVDIVTKEEKIVVDHEGYFGEAKFSYDGQYIAYVGSDTTFKNATHSNVYLYELETEITQNLTESIDYPIGDYAVADIQQGVCAPAVLWTEANDLYFQLSTMGDVQLYYASIEGAIYPASPEGEHIYDYAISKSGNSALMCISNPVFPGELYSYEIALGEKSQLTHFNENFLKEVELSTPERITSNSSDNLTIHGWLMKPIRYEEGKKYPLIVEIHGGPHTMYANTFFHELQLLAAQGYGVLYVNPRGSHGYSQSFVDSVRGNYGDGDYEDIMASLDTVLEEQSWIDRERLGVTGGSYGGFMTNWIVGHTNRFKAAVTQRSISNWVSFFGVSDIGYYFTPWQIGTDMMDPEKLWAHSPLKYAKNIETPLLILHSEEDFRCPIEQAEQLYMTLKSMGKETILVRFPKNNHNLSRTGTPNLRIERLDQLLIWFKKYL